MTTIRASLGQIRFRSIYEALKQLGMRYEENDNSAIVVWHDSLKDMDYFKSLKPWQIVNRIPNINVLCRKAPFTRIIQVISEFYPSLYSFVPKSYILPFRNTDLVRAISKGKDRYIIKPDSGSLGQGIVIVEPGEQYSPDDSLAIAQKYIPSLLLDDTKFDLRVYALVSSISPLEIYVYRDGIARFCSEKVGGNPIYSQITNVTLNKGNIEAEDISDISRLISDVFPELQNKYKINLDELWEKIDNVIILTVIAAHNYLKKGEEWQCPRNGYSRCFQILGFDILLDPDFNPHVLEVNYRPSLEYHRGRERRMKVDMIADAIRISAPLQQEQSALSARKWGWDDESWISFVKSSPELNNFRNSSKESALKQSKYKRIFPSNGPKMGLYEQVLDKVDSLPMDFLPGFKHPLKTVRNGEA